MTSTKIGQQEAMELVRKLLFGLQRARSASKEALQGYESDDKIVSSVLETIDPWLYGKNGEALLKAVSMVIDRGSITGMEFYNFMTIIHRLDSTIGMCVGILTDTKFPEPTIKLITDLEGEQ